MATTALQRGVFPFQPVPGLNVVKLVYARLPMNERKIAAIVFGVALDAGPIVRIILDPARVRSLLTIQPLPNLGMAFQTLEAPFARIGSMALQTMSRAIEGTVRV